MNRRRSGSARFRVEELEGRRLLAGPSLATIAPTTLDAGSGAATFSNLTIIPQYLSSVGANPIPPTVATFTDTRPGATASDITATITLSDGATVNGIVEANPDQVGQFIVLGRAPFGSPPAYVASVTIRDNVNGATDTATSGPPLPTDGPALDTVQRFGIHAQPTTLVLNFSQPLAPSTATDPANFLIRRLTPRGQPVVGPRGLVPIASATYAPGSDSVTLHPARRLDLHASYFLIVNGTPPNGLAGTTGLYLDGQHLGHPSGNATAVISYANLVKPPHVTPQRHPVRAARLTRRG